MDIPGPGSDDDGSFSPGAGGFGWDDGSGGDAASGGHEAHTGGTTLLGGGGAGP